MRRATTPTLRFHLSAPETEIKDILLTLAQDRGTRIDKHLADLHTTEDGFEITLTQTETRKFRADADIRIQIRILTEGDRCLASKIYTVKCSDVLNDEEMA